MVLDAEVEPEVFSSVEVVTSGTAHLPVDVQTAFEQRYGVAVLPSYGATEFAGGVAGWNLELHRRWAALNAAASDGRRAAGRSASCPSRTAPRCRAGEQGHIEVRTTGRDWVRTTDLGRVDADGFLFVDGRIDDVIIRGGFKVTPADIVMCCAPIRLYVTPVSPASPTTARRGAGRRGRIRRRRRGDAG